MIGENYEALLRAHRARYPLMQAQDCVKLLYQSEFGPMHLGENKEMLMNSIAEEWKTVPKTALPVEPERIGGGLCRFPLRPEVFGPEAARLLAGLMQQTMLHCQGNPERLRERMEQLSATEPELQHWLSETVWDYASPVRHSARFRAAYQPHYRLLRREYAGYFSVLLRIAQQMQKKRPLLIAIDGCCGSGKTQLAALLQALFPCRVFHTDHYVSADCETCDGLAGATCRQYGFRTAVDRGHTAGTVRYNGISAHIRLRGAAIGTSAGCSSGSAEHSGGQLFSASNAGRRL